MEEVQRQALYIEVLQSRIDTLRDQLEELQIWKKDLLYYIPHVNEGVAQARTEMKNLKKAVESATSRATKADKIIEVASIYADNIPVLKAMIDNYNEERG